MTQSNLNSENYYEILGCPRHADNTALKKAYRKLAVKWHPDKNPDNDQATTNFQKISEAYATLSNPEKRRLYDQCGRQGVDAADHMGGAEGFGFPPGGAQGVHFQGGFSPEDANKIFSDFFGSSDPFGGFGGGRGGMFQGGGSMNGMPPGVSFATSSMGGGGMPGMSFGGGGVDPISMMAGMTGMNTGMNFGGGGGGSGVDPMSMMFGGGGMPAGLASLSSQHQHQQQQQQYDIITRGTVVSLKGLINAPDRNGDKGIIQQHNAQTGRYIINLDEDGDSPVGERDKKTMSVKASNIQQHIQVQIHNIQNQVGLNGMTGTIVSWITSNDRYCIYITSQKKLVYLLPVNVILPNGTVAQIHGLQSKPELNSTFGTIKEWIQDTNKYDVQLSPQQVIRVKVENMRV